MSTGVDETGDRSGTRDRRHAARRDPAARPALVRTPDARRRRVRRALQVALLLLVAVVGYLAVSLYQVWSTGRSDFTGPVDAIVVMGAAQYDGEPSPQLAARLDHAAALWPEGRAGLVVVTGGKRPGDRFTEAEASAAYLSERGVPASAIVLEDQGTNSYESLRGVAALLDARGLDEVLIVTDPYHALRSRLIAGEVGLDAHVSPTPTSVVDGGERGRPPAPGGRRRGRRPHHRLRPPLRPFVRLLVHVRQKPDERSAGCGHRRYTLDRSVGSGVAGNTADSGSVIRGSSPLSPALTPPPPAGAPSVPWPPCGPRP